MKLKTLEDIRKTHLIAYIGLSILSEISSTYIGKEQTNEIIKFLNENSSSVESIENFVSTMYSANIASMFYCEQITKEYDFLENTYSCVIDNLVEFFKELKIDNSPVKIFATYVYMYRSGYLSHNKHFEYSIDMLDLPRITGLDVLRGTGVCRSISSMLTDIYRNLGYESYNLTVRASRESIDKLQKISHISLQKNQKSSKFAKFVGKTTKYIPLGNHLITMVSDGEKNYIFDPTNDGFLQKGKLNQITTFEDSTAKMDNYFWESILVNLYGMYHDGLNIRKQNKQLNMPTISDDSFRKEYLEALNFCIENDELFQKFYENNQEFYKYVNVLGKNINGLIKRFIPILPKKQK